MEEFKRISVAYVMKGTRLTFASLCLEKKIRQGYYDYMKNILRVIHL